MGSFPAASESQSRPCPAVLLGAAIDQLPPPTAASPRQLPEKPLRAFLCCLGARPAPLFHIPRDSRKLLLSPLPSASRLQLEPSRGGEVEKRLTAAGGPSEKGFGVVAAQRPEGRAKSSRRNAFLGRSLPSSRNNKLRSPSQNAYVWHPFELYVFTPDAVSLFQFAIQGPSLPGLVRGSFPVC